MKRHFTISLLLLIGLLWLAGSAHAQLLEDTDRKLKTVKTDRKFRLFRKKAKKAPAPFLTFGRTSSGKTITPVSRIPFSGRVANVRSRSASGSPFKTTRARAPRLSARSPFAGVRYSVRPRFSGGQPFTRKDMARAPRFSGPKPFTRKDMARAPRYSGPKPFTRKDMPDLPRFSGPMPFTRKDMNRPPRYSEGSPFAGIRWKIQPRYSAGMPFTRKDFVVNPRYSPGSPFAYRKWKVKPKYTGYLSFNMRMQKLREAIFPNRYISSFLTKRNVWKSPDLGTFSVQLGKYLGPLRMKPIKPGKNQHPSYRYKKSVLVASETVRNGLRKWNIFWTGFSRNSESPKGVKKKASKPKFDRKEREIWNN